MWLATEALATVRDVSAADIDRILSQDGFGNFAQLFASGTKFIQAGRDEPDPEGEITRLMYADAHWVLQYGYGEEEPGQMFQAARRLTLEQVRQAFLSFLAGGDEWRPQYTWEVIQR